MPLTKRFKDAFQEYQKLSEDFRVAQQIMMSSQNTYSKAKKALEEKIAEILKESNSCFPSEPSNESFERVVMIGDKTYIITSSPRAGSNSPIPPYIKEVPAEKC